MSLNQTNRSWARGPSAYLAMVVASFLLFSLIDHLGESSASAATQGSVAREAAKTNILAHVLITLAAVCVAGQIFGRIFRYFGQPPVIGEVIAGIALGPSLLGRIWPEATQFLMPKEIAPFIGVISQLGIILYMFLVGLELNPTALREGAGKSFAIAHSSILTPFIGGSALGLYLYPKFAGENVSFTNFNLFMGVSMAVTAFPVLARILSDRKMQTTPLGVTALSAAAAGDATAWCLLAFIVGLAQSAVGTAIITLLLTVAFVAFMLIVIRPLADGLLQRYDDQPLTPATTATIFVAVLASAVATEAIGIHALFGAFLLGAIIPHDSKLAQSFAHKLEDIVTVLLLPAFFASVGMRTEIGLVSGVENWLICGMIIVVATLGKFGGTYAAARFVGFDRRDSVGLGVLMNTRGLMELIVLNIGLEMKVISPTLFAMMVVMALVTTIATGPALKLAGIDGPNEDPAVA